MAAHDLRRRGVRLAVAACLRAVAAYGRLRGVAVWGRVWPCGWACLRCRVDRRDDTIVGGGDAELSEAVDEVGHDEHDAEQVQEDRQLQHQLRAGGGRWCSKRLLGGGGGAAWLGRRLGARIRSGGRGGARRRLGRRLGERRALAGRAGAAGGHGHRRRAPRRVPREEQRNARRPLNLPNKLSLSPYFGLAACDCKT